MDTRAAQAMIRFGLAAIQARRKDRTPPGPDKPQPIRDIFRADSAAAFDTMLTTATPFREPLVWFWASHFTYPPPSPFSLPP